MAGKHEREIPVIEGAGNVFADLGVAEPDEELAKAQLASLIRKAIRRRRLTQAEAAALTGLDQPKVSALVKRTAGGLFKRPADALSDGARPGCGDRGSSRPRPEAAGGAASGWSRRRHRRRGCVTSSTDMILSLGPACGRRVEARNGFEKLSTVSP